MSQTKIFQIQLVELDDTRDDNAVRWDSLQPLPKDPTLRTNTNQEIRDLGLDRRVVDGHDSIHHWIVIVGSALIWLAFVRFIALISLDNRTV